MVAIQIRSPPRPPKEESWRRIQTFRRDQCSRSGQSRSGSRCRSSGVRAATLSETAGNSFARLSRPHAYPISFCGPADHIDATGAPQAGDRFWKAGRAGRLIRVVRHFALTTARLSEGVDPIPWGESFRPGLEKQVSRRVIGKAQQS